MFYYAQFASAFGPFASAFGPFASALGPFATAFSPCWRVFSLSCSAWVQNAHMGPSFNLCL